MPKCGNCRNELPEGAALCPSCGVSARGSSTARSNTGRSAPGKTFDPEAMTMDIEKAEPKTDEIDVPIKSFAVQPADLSREQILAYAPRIRFRGAERPTVGRMILLAKLGQGGMGAVYFGIHPRLGTEVAVKVLAVQGGGSHAPEHVQRFLREARLAASLRSAHLVSVLDVDRDEKAGLHYIVMEFVRGYGANKWMEEFRKSNRPVPEHLALDVVIAATKGLAAAHDAGIVHRDVKPDNILIPKGPDGTPALTKAKLADLGLARTETGGDTVTGMPGMMGTPGFMPPEQVDGKEALSRAADIFSMGATLHALLAGQSPFNGPTPMATILHTVQAKSAPIRNLRPDVSPQTAALIARCLDPSSERRYPEANALLAALESARQIAAENLADQAAAASPAPAVPKTLIADSGGAAAPQQAWPAPHASRASDPPAAIPPTVIGALSPSGGASGGASDGAPPKRGIPIWLLAVGAVAALGIAGYVVFRPGSASGVKPIDVPEIPASSGAKPEPAKPRPEDAPKPEPEKPAVQPPVQPPVDAPKPSVDAPKPPVEDPAVRAAAEARRALADADGLLVAERFDEALAAFAGLRANPVVGADAKRGCGRVVTAILGAAVAAKNSGDAERAQTILAGLQTAAQTAPGGPLAGDDGYDGKLVSSRLAAIDGELKAVTKAREDLVAADRMREAGKYDLAADAYGRLASNAALRDAAARGLADTIRLAAKRAKKRQFDGDHLGAIDDSALVLRDPAAIPADGSIDVAAVAADLADSAVALGEWKRAEAALATIKGADSTAPRTVVVRGKLALASTGGGEAWDRVPAERDALIALPDDVRAQQADATLAAAERALARDAYDEAMVDARVALLMNHRLTAARFLIGRAAAQRTTSPRRRPKDPETARTFLSATIKEIDRDPNASAALKALRADAQRLLDTLPK